MRDNKIKDIALHDPYIIIHGNNWIQRCMDNKLDGKHCTSYHMRLTGILLIEMKNLTGQNNDMCHFLNPVLQ